jgi:hypothetical protein
MTRTTKKPMYGIPYISIFALLIFCTTFASAQNRGVGVGIIVGEPTGISTKIWTSQTNAIDIGVGWSSGDQYLVRTGNGYWQYVNDTYIHFYVDYLWHSFNAIHSEERFPLYYGVGMTIHSGQALPYNWLGVRGTFGIEWMPRRAPMDVFFEIAPTLQLAPFSTFGFNAGLGTRFYF